MEIQDQPRQERHKEKAYFRYISYSDNRDNELWVIKGFKNKALRPEDKIAVYSTKTGALIRERPAIQGAFPTEGV